MATRPELADVLFPEVIESIEDLLVKYPPRAEQTVLRFSPSPTGFFHFGNLYMALFDWKYTAQEQGVFYLRIEDTDQLRQVDGAVELLLNSLQKFGITIHEGPVGANASEVGEYGPYFQSQRAGLYKVFIKHLVSSGLAYPCWMREEELASIRDKQMQEKLTPGIYGDYSTYRSFTVDELIAKYHQEGDKFPVIRFRSHGDMTKKVVRNDEIRGEISMADNYNDIVIFKKDGLPTYHLAHIVDDTLMRTTLVSRGDEWLPSVPLHLQLFSAFGLPAPKYAHLAPVCKMDEGKKRKLSKRHDPEANVAFLFEKGYAAQGIIEYIFTLLNSNFEDWRRESPDVDVSKFHLSFATMNVAGPLFDETKLQWVNNGYLSRISTEELFTQTLEWAKEYAPAFSSLLLSDVEYAKVAMNIERHTEKDPKRFTLYSDVQHQLLFFFDSEWEKGESVREELFAGLAPLPSASCSTAGEKIGSSDVLVPGQGDTAKPRGLLQEKRVLQDFVREYCEVVNLETEDTMVWFEQLKAIGKKYGYAGNNAEFKEGGYIGKVGDLAMFLRIQLCNAKQTPDLFSVMKVLGKERVVKRLKAF